MAASVAGVSRFASFDEKEFDEILQNKDVLNTKKATKQAVTILREYLKEKCLDVNIKRVDKEDFVVRSSKILCGSSPS